MTQVLLGGLRVFFLKQKTAYERRISDWSSDVCSSDLSFKGLRGSWADPFGYSHERREERALIGEFEALTGRLITALRPDNIERATRLVELAGDIRGFGPVKTEAIARYRQASEQAERDLRNPEQANDA